MSNTDHDQDVQLKESLAERLAWAVDRLKSAEAEVTRLKRHIEGLREVLATMSHEPSLPGTALFSDLPSTGKRSLVRLSIKDALRTVLKTQSQPMTVRALYEALRIGGKKVGGKKPTDTVRAILRYYDDVFKKTPDAKWTTTNGVSPDHNVRIEDEDSE